ncbi:AbiTii domain-containing protein, partial [Corynebacterium casei]
MGRQDEALRIADELLADIELQRLKASEIVLKASRVARLVGHEELIEFLGFERNGYPTDGSARKWIEKTGRRTDQKANKYFVASIAKIEAYLAASQEEIEALRGGGNYSGDYIVVASRNHDDRIAGRAVEVARWSGICGQVVATVYDLIMEIYHELLFSELQASLFVDTQTKVDGLLSTSSGSALNKIESVSDRLRDGDPESVSQALTTCRRLIDSCADQLFPAQAELYTIGEQPLKVGQQNVLNRLQAYTYKCAVPQKRRDRLRRTFSDLYDRCSAGTHAEVSVEEARFVFLQTYIALGELLTLVDNSDAASPKLVKSA